MQRKTSTRFLVLLAVVAGLFVSLSTNAAPRRAQAQQPPDRRTISVTGVGNVNVSPDVAYIRAGVDVVNPALSTALNEARTSMDAVLAALRGAGIAEADIRTEQYSVFREDRFDPQTNQNQPNYRVINIARIAVRDVNRVGDVLNAAVEAGANSIQSVEFGVADVRPSETEARRLALTDAQARAQELASALGVTLGEVISIQETSGFAPFAPFERGGLGGGGGAGPVTGGTLQISVNLVVTYAIVSPAG